MPLQKRVYEPPEKAFAIWRRRVSESPVMQENHSHDSYEIYYLLEGERYYFIKNRTYPIAKGDLVFIKRNDIHRTLDAENPTHERILINFKKEFVSSLARDFPDMDIFSCFHREFATIRLTANEQETVETLLFRMLQEYKRMSYGASTSLKLLLCELLVFINRYISQHPENQFEHRNPLHKKISDVVTYINNNYMKPITLEHLSSEFFISPFYLSRVFKEVTGFTYVEYLNNVRIKEAQRLLRETGLKVTEVAEKSGYDSSTHFGRVFKESTGQSPLKYRKRFTS